MLRPVRAIRCCTARLYVAADETTRMSDVSVLTALQRASLLIGRVCLRAIITATCSCGALGNE